MDGFTACRELRAKTSVPIVMLSARDDETSIVVGLEVGADDYLTKPISVRELTSRVRAHLRRQRRKADTSVNSVLQFPGLEIDLLKYRVLAQGDPVELSAAQFKILAFLASHPGRVYSREQIMEPIWGRGLPCGSRAADVHIQNIRRKIEPEPTNPRHVLTVRGAGYRFAEVRD
jgi:DNA-binding response OmpR family regulator